MIVKQCITMFQNKKQIDRYCVFGNRHYSKAACLLVVCEHFRSSLFWDYAGLDIEMSPEKQGPDMSRAPTQSGLSLSDFGPHVESFNPN